MTEQLTQSDGPSAGKYGIGSRVGVERLSSEDELMHRDFPSLGPSRFRFSFGPRSENNWHVRFL